MSKSKATLNALQVWLKKKNPNTIKEKKTVKINTEFLISQ